MTDTIPGTEHAPAAPESQTLDRRRAQVAREQLRLRVRYVMRELRMRGWPGKWPRAMLITHKGWE